MNELYLRNTRIAQQCLKFNEENVLHYDEHILMLEQFLTVSLKNVF